MSRLHIAVHAGLDRAGSRRLRTVNAGQRKVTLVDIAALLVAVSLAQLLFIAPPVETIAYSEFKALLRKG